jgi:ribosomal protein L11 methylase PrmA
MTVAVIPTSIKVVSGGAVVLSGVKTEEAESLLVSFEKQLKCVWQADEGGWCGLVFIKEKR